MRNSIPGGSGYCATGGIATVACHSGMFPGVDPCTVISSGIHSRCLLVDEVPKTGLDIINMSFTASAFVGTHLVLVTQAGWVVVAPCVLQGAFREDFLPIGHL